MQQNVPMQAMQGLPPMQGIQAMQGMGMQGLQQNKFLPIQPNNQQNLYAQQKGKEFFFSRFFSSPTKSLIDYITNKKNYSNCFCSLVLLTKLSFVFAKSSSFAKH